MGEAGFRHGMTTRYLREITCMEEENVLLKKLLAEKEQEGHLKMALLKKNLQIFFQIVLQPSLLITNPSIYYPSIRIY